MWPSTCSILPLPIGTCEDDLNHLKGALINMISCILEDLCCVFVVASGYIGLNSLVSVFVGYKDDNKKHSGDPIHLIISNTPRWRGSHGRGYGIVASI